MDKYIQTFLAILSCIASNNVLLAQNNTTTNQGYYQTIDLNQETPCNCSDKTQRTYDLAKGLLISDMLDYEMYAYHFKFGNSTIPVSKLFKAMENDPNIRKVSMKEWDSFMLLTTNDFDKMSFETAANKIFAEFSEMQPEDFLKSKNQEVYEKYLLYTSSNPK